MTHVAVSNRVVARNVGGNTTYARKVLAGVRARGIEVTELGPELNTSKAVRAARTFAFESFRMAAEASRCGADVLFYPADTGPLVRQSLPAVVTVHGLAAIHVKGIRSPLQERVWMARVKRAVSSAEHVITVSRSSARDLVTAFNLPESKISCIPHGVDHDRFNTVATDLPEKLRGLPEQFALFIGNLEPRKNVIALLEAFDHRQLANSDLQLVIAGRPAWNADGILAAIKSHPKVTYLGWLADDLVVPLMQRAQMFVFPSWYEGFGFPPLEAMASGCPVVCSTKGSLGEVVGSAAMTVSEPKPAELVNAIVELHSDINLRDSLKAQGLARAREFHWADSFEAHERVFESVAGRLSSWQ